MQKPRQISIKSGVYVFRNAKQKPLYIGKAGNLKKRLVSYWLKNASSKTQRLVREATSLAWRETDSEIEALILEARLIKQYMPKYNVLMRDDKNYFYVGMTREEFPRIFITHQPLSRLSAHSLRLSAKNKITPKAESRERKATIVGPFTSGNALKTTLKLLRRIFPYCTCKTAHKRKCLNAEIGRCLGYCCDKRKTQNAERKKEYRKNIKTIIAILRGKKQKLLAELKKRMREKSQKQEYERAALLRNQVAGLEDIFAHKNVLELPTVKQNWLVLEQKLRLLLGAKKQIHRIEGYDISNISGTDATGSMVVFSNGKPDKKECRTFKIKTVRGANDPAMIGEVIARRLNHKEWQYPDIMVIDGGKAQHNAANAAFAEIRRRHADKRRKTSRLRKSAYSQRESAIIIVALAKREEELYTEKRNAPIPLKTLDRDVLHLFQVVRDEAHRFAKKYHHTLRRKTTI